ncbi:MAG: lycopene cyclase family protein [Corynebacterium sp.]|uniref:lycopene cyclase family protein n=1 Tax=Corynebacterium sp. TaxID=1720 RepID=UPI0026DA8722|nr:lycopene cyclase family protein [Corynebacterium sp.]MDO5029081.1 lycopene cyclase family protein [Corynebacterium sp.]
MSNFPVTASVVGLGPAGRIAAHRAAARGWDVTAFDPAGGKLPSTIGIWCDQLPDWAPADFLSATFQPSVILADGSARTLNRSYGVINKESLDALGGFSVERRILQPADSGSDTDITVVTTGAAHAAVGPRGQVRQLAIGHIFSLDDVPSGSRRPVLMDFTPAEPHSAQDEPASFSYRIALDHSTFLIEETILATPVDIIEGRADDTALLQLLRRRQSARLAALGVDEKCALDEEVVSFSLLAKLPGHSWKPHKPRVALFGFAGGWMHPATGYSVGAVLADCDRFLTQLESERAGWAGARWTSLSSALTSGFSDSRHRVQRWLRERGLSALLGFNAQQTAEFFDAFFSLPDDDVFAYLIGTSPLLTLRTMAKVARPLARISPWTCALLMGGFLRGPASWRFRGGQTDKGANLWGNTNSHGQ